MCFVVLNKLYNFKVSVLVSAILVLYLLGIGYQAFTSLPGPIALPHRGSTLELGAQARSEHSPLQKWSGSYTLHTAFLKHMGLRFSRLLWLSCFFSLCVGFASSLRQVEGIWHVQSRDSHCCPQLPLLHMLLLE